MMNKKILALIAIFSLASSNYSYSYRYEIYEEPEYVYDDEYVVYEEEPEYIYEPVYYSRPRPVIRERVVYREPRTVRVNSNSGAAIASGLIGFAAGTALGAAIAD